MDFHIHIYIILLQTVDQKAKMSLACFIFENQQDCFINPIRKKVCKTTNSAGKTLKT